MALRPLAYSYAAGNPLKYVDPDGSHPILIGAAVGILVGLAFIENDENSYLAFPAGAVAGATTVAGGMATAAAMSPARLWLAGRLAAFGAAFNRLAGSGCSDRGNRSAAWQEPRGC